MLRAPCLMEDFVMKSGILGLMIVLAVSGTASAATRGRCRGGSCKVVHSAPATTKVYSMPTVGSSTYAIEHQAVARPSCKDGKCRLSK